MTTRIETDDLRRALEALWTDMGVLARSPLVEQLDLVEGWPERDRQDAYKRASALIDAILDAAQRLRTNDGEEAFALLDRVYGLNGAEHKLITRKNSADSTVLSGKSGEEKVLDAAVVQLLGAMSSAGSESV
jgi:hypothetical protein